MVLGFENVSVQVILKKAVIAGAAVISLELDWIVIVIVINGVRV